VLRSNPSGGGEKKENLGAIPEKTLVTAKNGRPFWKILTAEYQVEI
jgi:hypothetical protein